MYLYFCICILMVVKESEKLAGFTFTSTMGALKRIGMYGGWSINIGRDIFKNIIEICLNGTEIGLNGIDICRKYDKKKKRCYLHLHLRV